MAILPLQSNVSVNYSMNFDNKSDLLAAKMTCN